MKILVALDDSIRSQAAVDAVIAQMGTKDTEVRLLHVLEPYPASLAEVIGGKDSPDFVAARVRQRERARKFLGQAVKKLQSAGFKVTFSVLEGEARSVILDRAEKWNADLVVVGSHDRKGLARFLLGSVSAAVARYARCSVQIVRIRSQK
jgi:nucleotide-binding universal stress UspA family protein